MSKYTVKRSICPDITTPEFKKPKFEFESVEQVRPVVINWKILSVKRSIIKIPHNDKYQIEKHYLSNVSEPIIIETETFGQILVKFDRENNRNHVIIYNPQGLDSINNSYLPGKINQSDYIYFWLHKQVTISYLIRKINIMGSEIPLLKIWTQQQSHTCQIYYVSPESDEYRKLCELIKISYSEPDKITKIHLQRIQNYLTYGQYYQEKMAMCHKNGFEIRNIPTGYEQILFHGTRNIPPKTIYSSMMGFDPRLSGNGLWGRGSYFTDSVNYVLNYSYVPNDNKETYQFMIALVLVGNSFDYEKQCNTNLTRPPLNVFESTKSESRRYDIPGLYEGIIPIRYDSVTGISKDANIYCVYNLFQSYSSYIVTLELAPSLHDVKFEYTQQISRS